MKILLSTVLLLVSGLSSAQTMPPIADIHLHYKWSQEEVTSVEQALAILDANQVSLGLVVGVPPDHARKLSEAAPGRLIPSWSVYQLSGKEKSLWSFDRKVLTRAREAIASGLYKAIGEVHMIPGFMARPSTPVVKGLLELAAEYDVPFWVHTEFSRPKFMIDLCNTHPKVRFLWAHAGSVLSASQVDDVMAACPNIWTELAARDPWRHLSEIITDDSGRLKPDWEQLVLKYPDRFMVGSDPVWPVMQLDAWDEPDTGWERLTDFLTYHRTWINHLPEAVAEKVRLHNAQRFFGLR